MLNNMCS